MKIIQAFALTFILLGALCAKADRPAALSIFTETPAKTVIIKNSAAGNVDQFFTATSISFEVYKIGDAKKVAELIKKNKDVQSCEAGKATGDYQALNVTLKSAKDKAFWMALFKSAGLNNIKINNGEITATDKI